MRCLLVSTPGLVPSSFTPAVPSRAHSAGQSRTCPPTSPAQCLAAEFRFPCKARLLLPKRLFRQPGGFEGLLLVAVDLDPHDLSTAQRVDHSLLSLRRGPAT